MWWRGVMSRWFSPRCLICALERAAPILCAGCTHDFIDAQANRCRRCAIPLHGHLELCGACLHAPPHFDATVALADYAAPIDGLVLALKFGHRLELAPRLGLLLADRARALRGGCSLMVAVPLAYERLAQRGFNQSFEIARAAARALDAPLDHRAIVRVRHAAAQASLQLADRRRNVRGAFVVRGDVRGRRLLVVDDVMTSGSTLDEVARVLKAAGAQHVTNLVVARTP
jgi:ComF family protein